MASEAARWAATAGFVIPMAGGAASFAEDGLPFNTAAGAAPAAYRLRPPAPIIVLSGRTSPGDKIGALGVGADDYVTKPFAMAELLARLRALLRRDEAEVGRDQPRQATVGRWLVDLTAHQVRRASAGEEETLRLTPTEWQILELLLNRPGKLPRSRLRPRSSPSPSGTRSAAAAVHSSPCRPRRRHR